MPAYCQHCCREVGPARADCSMCPLRTERDALRAEVEQLTTVLRVVERCGSGLCPACCSATTHSEDCVIGIALTPPQDATKEET